VGWCVSAEAVHTNACVHVRGWVLAEGVHVHQVLPGQSVNDAGDEKPKADHTVWSHSMGSCVSHTRVSWV
jgi:hypothetical protein